MSISAHIIRAFSEEITKIASEESDPSLDPDKVRRDMALWRKLKKTAPGEVHINEDAHEYGGGYFDPKDKSIGLSENDYESLAHELGHAELDKRLAGRALQHPIGRAAFPLTPIAAALAGVLLARGKKRGLALPAATASPTLLSEALATRRGAKKLEEAGATPEEIEQYKKSLNDSYKSYSRVLPESAIAGALTYGASL